MLPIAPIASGSMHGAIVPIAFQSITTTGVYQVTFSNIPQKYQDLFLVGYTRSASSGTTYPSAIYLNNTGVTGWSITGISGNGSSAFSGRNTQSGPTYGTIFTGAGASATSGIFTAYELHLLNYANTSTYKTSMLRAATDLNGSGLTEFDVGLWSNTSGINEIDIQHGTSFAIGSQFALYGIRTVGQ